MAATAPPLSSIVVHQLDDRGLEVVGQRLHDVGAGERVDGLGHVGLVGDDLLGAQRQPGRLGRRQRDGLVEGVGVQALGAAEDGAEALQRNPDQVDLGLLRGELDAGRLGVEAQRLALRVLGAEVVAHHPGPDPPGGAELGDLLEQGRPGDEEERQPGGEVVDRQTGGLGGPDVLDRVGQGEGDLLRGRGPGLGHVVARDGDGVPARNLLVAVGEDVADQPQRLGRREDVGAAGDVLLEHVVLDRAGEAVPRRRPAPRRPAGRAAAGRWPAR